MAKIFKAMHMGGRALSDYGREALEQFPDAEPIALELPPALQEEPGPEEEVDPAALQEQVLEEARAEAERKVQEAYQEGLQRGMEAGREQFDQSTARAAECLESAAQAMKEARQTFLDSLEQEVLSLSTLIAERVLQREIRTDPELVKSTARRALAKIADRQRIRITVNPEDLEALRTHEVSLLEEFSGIETLVIEADESVTPGGCIADSGRMQVDARMETLLDAVLEKLTE